MRSHHLAPKPRERTFAGNHLTPAPKSSESPTAVPWFTGLGVILMCLTIIILLLPDASQSSRTPIVEQAIQTASAAYKVDVRLLRRRAWCESRNNPRAVNRRSHASGLFQFLPSTWRTTPFGHLDIFNPWVNALAAAWMVSVGRNGEWVCK